MFCCARDGATGGADGGRHGRRNAAGNSLGEAALETGQPFQVQFERTDVAIVYRSCCGGALRLFEPSGVFLVGRALASMPGAGCVGG